MEGLLFIHIAVSQAKRWGTGLAVKTPGYKNSIIGKNADWSLRKLVLGVNKENKGIVSNIHTWRHL